MKGGILKNLYVQTFPIPMQLFSKIYLADTSNPFWKTTFLSGPKYMEDPVEEKLYSLKHRKCPMWSKFFIYLRKKFCFQLARWIENQMISMIYALIKLHKILHNEIITSVINAKLQMAKPHLFTCFTWMILLLISY